MPIEILMDEIAFAAWDDDLILTCFDRAVEGTGKPWRHVELRLRQLLDAKRHGEIAQAAKLEALRAIEMEEEAAVHEAARIATLAEEQARREAHEHLVALAKIEAERERLVKARKQEEFEAWQREQNARVSAAEDRIARLQAERAKILEGEGPPVPEPPPMPQPEPDLREVAR